MKNSIRPALIISVFFLMAVSAYYVITNLNQNRINNQTEFKSTPKQETDAENHPNLKFERISRDEDFELAGVKLNLTSAQLLKVLGEPASKERVAEPSIHNPDYTTYYETWVYDDLDIIFMTSAASNHSHPSDPGIVMSIKVKRGGHQTYRGIKIGDSLFEVLKKYGNVKPDKNLYIYESDQSDLRYISFKAGNNRVQSIEIGLLFD